MFEFAHSGYLWLLGAVPLMLVVFIAARYYRRKAMEEFGDPGIIGQLMPLASPRRQGMKFFLLMLSIVFIILSLAGPRFGSRLEEVKREGVEIIIALDVSNSMLAEDIRPNRLEASKLSITRLTSDLRNDRIGLIVFAGDAFVQVPVTSDYSAFRMILDNVSTDIVPVQGTAIGRAIELAMRSFTSGSTASRILIIMSDGEDHEDNPVRISRMAREEGIIIHTVGLGRPEGSPVPAAGHSRFLTDEEGTIVITRLDEATLRGIASEGGGLYVRAGSTGSGLDIIRDEIEKMEKSGFEELQYTEFDERFQYMAFVALFLLIIDFVIMEKKNQWLNSLNLFKYNTRRNNEKFN
jgi:Ca-activated chloride channel homolog